MLAVNGLTVKYSGLTALDSFSIEVLPGDAAGLIGANGAGKSSAINAMTGAISSRGGSVLLNGHEVRGKPLHAIVRAGLGRTFQQARLWPVLTIRENLLLARPQMAGGGEAGRRFEEMAAELGLTDLLDVPASNVAYGSRRLVEVLRAALLEPKIMLLDEPAAGLSPHDKNLLANFLSRMRERGVGTLVVDHDMAFVRQACRRLHVLESGRFLARGTVDEVFAMQSVRDSYLGSEVPHA